MIIPKIYIKNTQNTFQALSIIANKYSKYKKKKRIL